MRTPTSPDILLRWWRTALLGLRPVRIETDPQCGWYRMRLYGAGPWVPARIWCHQDIDPETGELADDERILCEVDGQMRDPVSVWTRVQPITREQYDALIHLRESVPLMQATMAAVDLSLEPMRPT